MLTSWVELEWNAVKFLVRWKRYYKKVHARPTLSQLTLEVSLLPQERGHKSRSRLSPLLVAWEGCYSGQSPTRGSSREGQPEPC